MIDMVVEKYKIELLVVIYVYNMCWKMQIYCFIVGYICQENEICDEFFYDFFICKMIDRLCSCMYCILCVIKFDLYCFIGVFLGIIMYYFYNFIVIK